MKICPECHDEFRDEISVCVECQIPLQPFMKGMTFNQKKDSERVDPATAVKIFEGQLPACKELQETLRGRKIASMVAPLAQKPGGYCLVINADKVDAYAGLMKNKFEEMVAKENAAVLRLEEIQLDGNDVTCPACGHVGQLHEEACQECGLVLGVSAEPA